MPAGFTNETAGNLPAAMSATKSASSFKWAALAAVPSLYLSK
jgi:hypothetical protein